MLVNHPENRHTCNICGIKVNRLFNLYTHVKKIHKLYPRNVCKYCPTKDDRLVRRKNLITTHPYNTHMCVAHACTYTTRLLGDLRHHALNKHNSIASKICRYCADVYTEGETRKPEADAYIDVEKPEAAAAVYTEGETRKPDADDGYKKAKTSYKCATPYCTFTTKYSANLRRHERHEQTGMIHKATNNCTVRSYNKTEPNVYKNTAQENTEVQTTIKKVDSNRFYIELVILNNK